MTVHFHRPLELVFKRPALCRSSHVNILLLGLVWFLSMWSRWGQLVQLTITSQWYVMPLALRGSCPQHRGSAGQLRKFRLCQLPMTLQPVPKHRSCDFPQAVLKFHLVISSCRANCRWFLLKIIQHITERAGMWTLLQSSCWKSMALLSLYLLPIVATLKLSSESCGI